MSFESGFFAQLPNAGVNWRGIGGIDYAAWNFQFGGISAVAVLFDHDQLSLRCQGDDVDPIGALEDVHVVCAARARRRLQVTSDLEYTIFTKFCGFDQRPGLNHESRFS